MEKFFTGQAKRSQPSSSAQSDSSPERDEGDAPVPPKAVPKGVVLGKDGKPYVVFLGCKNILMEDVLKVLLSYLC